MRTNGIKTFRALREFMDKAVTDKWYKLPNIDLYDFSRPVKLRGFGIMVHGCRHTLYVERADIHWLRIRFDGDNALVNDADDYGSDINRSRPLMFNIDDNIREAIESSDLNHKFIIDLLEHTDFSPDV